MINQFTKQKFEQYLQSNHSPFRSLGLMDGEEVYEIILDNQVSIIIRSSVKSDGLSADVGKDSIRCWLVRGDITKPLGSKMSKWTTRQVGWQDKLSTNIKQFVLWRALAGDCGKCGKAKGIFRSRTEANKGRPFAKCKEHDGFVWLDEPIKTDDIYFSEESKSDTNTKQDRQQMARPERAGSHKVRDIHANILRSNGESDISESNLSRNEQDCRNLQELPKSPNEAQKSAIEADINANIRVLAAPGSGKTFVIEQRYKYLIENSVKPENILVCTFSKAMADEMGKRIQETCPEAILDQISTIHAFCYRILCRWYPDSRYYKWQVPKDWQVKKCLEETIGIIWQEKERPNVKEIYDYICTSKNIGLTTDNSYELFVGVLGQQYGEWLYKIRSKFDAWLNRNRFLTFADMLFLTEQRLRSDEMWRTMLQERFSHVIVDEAQDTNAQAMRILITISFEPGKNEVYR